ncbi:MAG: ISNCY family transposase [Deltaproteobacteria bacterium]|nr:ISNCY family transposase [Deltaproteobacteria bacterium]
MRKVINLQMEFWKKDIANIEFDLKSRDEIPKLLMGLQHIYRTAPIRKKVFEVLKQIVPKKSQEIGRPGMDLWKILVLGTLRLNCNWDFDKVHEIANNHSKLREMLGHSKTDFDCQYALQTIKDNISLLTPSVLDEINQIVVKTGHGIISKKKEPELRSSCDSFVVETDVHYPTDANLLFDAIRKIISLIAIICSEIGITDWRQSHHNITKIKRLLRGIQKLKRSKSKDEKKKEERDSLIATEHQKYIGICQGFVFKSKETIRILREMMTLSTFQNLRLSTIEEYIRHAERQIDQIYRRTVLDEKIPHEEKVFSIFEQHTEWLSKGKAGVPQELGLKVCVLKDQFGFILHHLVMEQQTDDKVAVDMTQGAKDRFENLSGCSFDKGFYTPGNKSQLANILDYIIMPKKGRLSAKDKQIEQSEEFIKYRRKHSSVESSINALENHGLDRCLDHGLDGFKRYVALSVVARNIQILGHLLQQKELKRQKRRKAA